MKRLIILIISGFYFFSSQVLAQSLTCSYKVKSGDWVAKILRDLGSKDPFKDQSYFKTIKLNNDNKSIHKLVVGDRIKLPKEVLSQKARATYCQDKALKTVKRNKIKKEVVLKVNNKKNNKAKAKAKIKTRLPASISTYSKKPSHQKQPLVNKAKVLEKEKDPFPILEYDALLPSGGAK